MKINVIFVGLGQMAIGYDRDPLLKDSKVKHSLATAMKLNSQFNLIAGVDPDEQARNRFFQEIGVPTYKNLESIPNELIINVDAFVVTASTYSHLEIMKGIGEMSANSWILCEKPMGASLSEALLLEQYIDSKRLMVNYSRRFSSGIVYCRKVFEKSFRETKTERAFLTCQVYGGDLRTGSHFLDLCRLWFGDSTARIESGDFIELKQDGFLLKYELADVLYQNVENDSEESYAVLTFQSGLRKVSLIRGNLIELNGSEKNVVEVTVNQSETVEAFYELIKSKGSINKSSFANALIVHKIVESIKNCR